MHLGPLHTVLESAAPSISASLPSTTDGIGETSGTTPRKIGAGFRQYPRCGGVLVPGALRELAPRDLADEPLPVDQAQRLRLGRTVVAAIAKGMHHLPGSLLARPLPPPSIFVGSCAIEHRTRNVVERLVPYEIDRDWNVARYLQVRKFGPRCLTDLLAAHEELLRAPAPNPDDDDRASLVEPSLDMAAPPLGAVVARVRGQLPLTDDELATMFPAAGFARDAAPLRALAAVLRRAGVAAPFRIVTRNGNDLGVPLDGAGVARALCESASRQVTAWGLSAVAEVVSRVDALSAQPASATIARRVLVALPRLRWLDDNKEWFSLVDERSPLRRAVLRVFSVAERVAEPVLRDALAKTSPTVHRAPPAVLARYLSEIAGCAIVDGEVRARRPGGPVALDDDEALLVERLRAEGGEAALPALRDLLPAHPEARRRLERLIERSPLFLRAPHDPDRLRLVGPP